MYRALQNKREPHALRSQTTSQVFSYMTNRKVYTGRAASRKISREDAKARRKELSVFFAPSRLRVRFFSVFWHLRVDLIRPGRDATFYILDLLISRVLEDFIRLGAAATHLAVEHDLFVGIDL